MAESDCGRGGGTCKLRDLPGRQRSGPECSRQGKQDLRRLRVRRELEVSEGPKGQCGWREVREVREESRAWSLDGF